MAFNKGNVGVNRWVKLADESRQSTTSFADDAELGFVLPASTVYTFELYVFFATPTTGGLKYQIDSTGTVVAFTARWALLAPGATVWSGLGVDTAIDVVRSTVAVGEGCLEVKGRIVTGGTAGLLTFEWAQQASQASNTTVRSGSWMEFSQAV